MNLLDRYIARQYLINIATLLVLLSCFVVAVDFSVNLQKYWNSPFFKDMPDVGYGVRRALITTLLVVDLWWPRLLNLFNFMIGLVLVGAMGFTLSQLVRHRELVAVLTSGQSLYRIIRPFVIVSLGMVALQALNQQFITPRIAGRLVRENQDLGKQEMGASRVPPTLDAKGRLFYANSFDADTDTLKDLYVWDRDPETSLATRRLYAKSAIWKDGGWELDGGIWESRESGVKPKPEPATRFETELDPTMLRMKRYAIYGQNLSFTQATAMLRRVEMLGTDPEVTRHNRDQLIRASLGHFSSMVASMLTLLISMSFFLVREPRNMAIQSLKCAPIGIAAIIAGVLGTSVGIPGMPTSLSVFIPVMVLTPLAIAMLTRVRT
jgi:lipopolysaccharide export LptBFGC system permease protein LptF